MQLAARRPALTSYESMHGHHSPSLRESMPVLAVPRAVHIQCCKQLADPRGCRVVLQGSLPGAPPLCSDLSGLLHLLGALPQGRLQKQRAAGTVPHNGRPAAGALQHAILSHSNTKCCHAAWQKSCAASYEQQNSARCHSRISSSLDPEMPGHVSVKRAECSTPYLHSAIQWPPLLQKCLVACCS